MPILSTELTLVSIALPIPIPKAEAVKHIGAQDFRLSWGQAHTGTSAFSYIILKQKRD